MQIWWRERFAKHFLSSDLGAQARTEFEVREIFDDMGQVTWKGSGNRVNAKRWHFQLMLRVDNIAFAQSFIFMMVYGSPNVIWLKFCDVRCCQVWVFSVLCWIDGEIPDFRYKRGCREPLSPCILRAQKLSLRFCGKILLHRSQAELQRLVQGVRKFIWKAINPTSGHVLFLGYHHGTRSQLFLGWRWFHPSLPDSRCSRWSLPGR